MRDFLTQTWRRIKRNRLYSLVNLMGMTLGLICLILIGMHVKHETSFDKFHEKSDRIFRLNVGNISSGNRSAVNAGVIAPMISPDFAEIENFVRFRKFPSLLTYDDQTHYEDDFYYTDSTIFDVFDFKLSQGNPSSALDAPNSVILTSKMAKKYFGEDNPIGKILQVDSWSQFQVTGVLEDLPTNSHIGFEFLASISSLKNHPDISVRYWQLNSWYSHYYHTYLLLTPHVDYAQFSERIELLAKEYSNPDFYELYGREMGIYLQPLTDIHLATIHGELKAQGNKRSLYILSTAAIVILLIACSNFTNLATVLALKRRREVGIRKILGADSNTISLTFLGESFLFTTVSALLAVIFISAIFPILSLHYPLSSLTDPKAVFILAGIIGFTTLLSGLYPAGVAKMFAPMTLTKTENGVGRKMTVNKYLIAFQFALSCGLVAATLAIYNQLRFMENQPLGMDLEPVVAIPTRGNPEVNLRYDAFRNELLSKPEVINLTRSELIPGEQISGFVCRFEGMDAGRSFPSNPVGYDFFDTYGIEILAGRVFSRDYSTDTLERAVINRSLARELGWNNPEEAIGKTYDFGNDGENEGFVIGVVEDVHFRSLRYDIRPMLFLMDDHFYHHISIQLTGKNMRETLASIEDSWYAVFPNIPCQVIFADEFYGLQYHADREVAHAFLLIVGLAIFLACIGLLGTTAFNIQQRTREIGIRKVLGASMQNIVTLVSRDLILLVLIGIIVSLPITAILIENWLEDFAYRTHISFWVYMLAGIFGLMVACGTSLFQSVRAASVDPTHTLRNN